MENRYLAKKIIARSIHPSLFLSISWVIDDVVSLDILAMLWNALQWKTLSEISKTAGKLDRASVWNYMTSRVSLLRGFFPVLRVCDSHNLDSFCKKLCYAAFSLA